MSTTTNFAEHAAKERFASDYLRIRRASLKIAQRLSPEDQMVQSMPDCSPTKWHLAHTTWFFETFILANVAGYRAFNDSFRTVFNSYYKQLGDHPFRGDRGTFSRPSLQEVLDYREHVDIAMQALLQSEIRRETSELIELGLNHEQQHQELILTDIKHAFFSQPLRPAYQDQASGESSRKSPAQSFIHYPGGIVEIGHSGEGFSFDNELPRHSVLLQPFHLGSRPVTNAEYQEFMRDDGYARPELWLSDGWDTAQRLAWKAPLYWERHSGEWSIFTLQGTRAIDPNEPVCHISFYEADAFARWAGARLPRETEWEHAAPTCVPSGNFMESGHFHPQPAVVSEDPDPQQMFGDLWEWTASAYLGYPGFRPAAGVVGEYNGKFMCNQFVLRGGSCATPQSHIRATYRNFFPPHARWQFMGIRLATDEL